MQKLWRVFTHPHGIDRVRPDPLLPAMACSPASTTRIVANVRRATQRTSPVGGRASETQPLPTRSRPQRHRKDRLGDSADIDGRGAYEAGTGDAGCCEDDLTGSTTGEQNHPQRHGSRGNSNAARHATRNTRHPGTRGSTDIARAAKTAPASRRGRTGKHHQQQPRLERTQGGGRPRTTGTSDQGSFGDGSGEVYGDSNSPSESRLSSSRLLATAPASTGITEAAAAAAGVAEPRYLAARIAGEMSARAYYNRQNPVGVAAAAATAAASCSPGNEEASSVTARPHGSPLSKGTGSRRPARGGGRQQQRQHRRPRVGADGGDRAGRCCSSSEVSVSSCGDMTVSSEEHEGEDMAYTG